MRLHPLRSLLAPDPGALSFGLVLSVAALVLGAAALLRGMEYDEAYTVFLAAGNPRPDWPAQPFLADSVWFFYHGGTDAVRIARDLRALDVHPPIYFWAVAAWRGVMGFALVATRLLSVLCSLGTLALVGGLARRIAAPPIACMLLTLGCYGFAYTGAIARGFAAASLLTVAGVALLLAAQAPRRPWRMLLAGMLLGAASCTNYLSAFVGGAGLLWLLLRDWRLGLVATCGFLLFIPADLWFFLAQRGSRPGQFPPFALLPSLARLAQFAAANLFGGLPLYVGGAAQAVLKALLAAGSVALAGLVAWRWPRIGGGGRRWLFAMAAAAMPAGLVLLGLVFDNTPIELRYLSFAVPFAALLIGAAGATLGRNGRIVLVTVLAVQAAALAGLLTRPETMQPQARAAAQAAALAGPQTLVLLARGNDGVGVVGPFVQAAPADLRILLVRAADPIAATLATAQGFPRVLIARLELDADSRIATPRLLAAFAAAPACWRAAPGSADVAVFDRVC